MSPDNITQLADDEVIVVGTNIHGQHAGGAAKQAHEQFGLEWGVGEGMCGNTYALPTMEGFDAMADAVQHFLEYATAHPEVTFLLTRVGCGIAGYTEAEVAPLFADAPENVKMPRGWRLLTKQEIEQ